MPVYKCKKCKKVRVAKRGDICSNCKKLSDKRKKHLRENFDKINKAKLSKAEISYYNKIKAGKARSKKAIRIQGKYLSGEIVDTIAKVAHSKGKKLQTYIDENTEAIVKLIEAGSTHVSKDIDKVIEIISGMKRKTVSVNTGKKIKKMTKSETIAELSAFQQHVKSTTKIVMLATNVEVFKNNKIQITIPEDYDDYQGSELVEYLDEFDDIFYVES